jgi:parallel beta-helix repeat protein
VNTGSGVHVTGGAEGIGLTGNTISYNGQHGLLLDNANCTVTGNFFLQNSWTGAGGTTNTADDINIAHGTFSAVGNMIAGNVIDGAGTSRYGINFSVSTDTAGVAVANRIINSVTAATNTAATDTVWVGTTGVASTPATDLALYLAPSGATGETYPRSLCNNNTAALTTQQSVVSAIPLPGGLPIVNLGVMISGTGFTGVTHGWLALLDSGRVVRAVTADQTSAFGSAFSALPIPISGSYTTPAGGLYYLVACVTATGMGTLSIGVSPGSAPNGTAPILSGTSGGSLTTPPATGTTMAAITSNGAWRFYGYTS